MIAAATIILWLNAQARKVRVGGTCSTSIVAADKKNLPIATFNAVLSMVMLNGSALHKHQISNFSLTDISIPKMA